MTWIVHNGDALEVLRGLESCSFDAMLTDPPAGIGFMGKAWDKDKGGRDNWIAWLAEIMTEAIRVLKPGAHALVWSLPRTSHWTGTALEVAGFEVRDCVYHLFGSGFPKSLNVSKAIDRAAGATREVVGRGVSWNRPDTHKDGDVRFSVSPGEYDLTAPATDLAKAWDGYGTALKPAAECWWLVRKPLEGTVAANVAKWGTGAIAIEACRIGEEDGGTRCSNRDERGDCLGHQNGGRSTSGETFHAREVVGSVGRWPANVTLDERAAKMLDRQVEPTRSTGGKPAQIGSQGLHGGMAPSIGATTGGLGDFGGPSRFFYVAKPSSFERDFGCDEIDVKAPEYVTGRKAGSAGAENPRAGKTGASRNHHPTIKGVSLTRYLAALIRPPHGGRLLVPFAGSGGEMIGGMRAGFAHVEGVERDPEFAEIARARLSRWAQVQPFAEIAKTHEDPNQLPLFP